MKLYAQFSNGRIIPEYASDYDKVAKLRKGETYQVDIKQPRNIGFHRRYFALLNLCFENQEHFVNLDDMREWLQMKAGYYKRVQTPTGEMYRPMSISFASMDETEFREVYSRVLDQVVQFLDIRKQDIEMEIINFM